MAFDAPVLATGIFDARELVTDGEAERLVELVDLRALTAAVDRVVAPRRR